MRLFERLCKEEHGQATVEYVLVVASFIAIVVGLGLLGKSLQQGLFVDHAVFSASHNMQGDAVGAVQDVLLF